MQVKFWENSNASVIGNVKDGVHIE